MMVKTFAIIINSVAGPAFLAASLTLTNYVFLYFMAFSTRIYYLDSVNWVTSGFDLCLVHGAVFRIIDLSQVGDDGDDDGGGEEEDDDVCGEFSS
jgi:hypothetical protein